MMWVLGAAAVLSFLSSCVSVALIAGKASAAMSRMERENRLLRAQLNQEPVLAPFVNSAFERYRRRSADTEELRRAHKFADDLEDGAS